MPAPGWWLVAQLVLAIFTAVWGGFRVAPWLVASSPGCFDQFWCCTVWAVFVPAAGLLIVNSLLQFYHNYGLIFGPLPTAGLV
ncbi:hypothetical protein FB45DRAFT_930233, partial [Roridomyces roridus]